MDLFINALNAQERGHMPTTQPISVSADQYRALQRPLIELPTPAQLFDFQVETLVGKGLATYEHADPFRKDLPSGLFLLVPPQPAKLDLTELMAKVELVGKTGVNTLDAGHLTDIIETPAGPYLMIDVEDGAGRLNTKPSISRQNIKKEGRSPYTAWRGIIHTTVFPQVLSHHYLELVGSRYGKGRVPCLYLNGGHPKLDYDWG
ncbi:MAG TPA: DUF5701 family protein, partial [Candidatus Paceibacterota bacterium]